MRGDDAYSGHCERRDRTSTRRCRPLDVDVVVDVDARVPPLADDQTCRRQRSQRGAIDPLEELPPALAVPPHHEIVQLLEHLADPLGTLEQAMFFELRIQRTSAYAQQPGSERTVVFCLLERCGERVALAVAPPLVEVQKAAIV